MVYLIHKIFVQIHLPFKKGGFFGLYPKIDFNWGAESNITEEITLRVGSKHRLFAKNESKDKLSTPILNYINVGLTYNYNQETQIDIAYLPYVQVGDDTTTDINISLTKVF